MEPDVFIEAIRSCLARGLDKKAIASCVSNQRRHRRPMAGWTSAQERDDPS